jgi:putative ABC transport system permease protein
MDGDLSPFTIIGVVGDVQEYGIGSPPRATFYSDYRQRPRTASEFHVVIQGAFDAAAMIAAARRVANALDPEVPTRFERLREVVSASLADRRFVLVLLGLFGGLALMLATTGVYGVVTYMALQRTPEIGVRVALGAQPRDVVRLLVGQGALFATAGIAVGLVAAFMLARLLESLLYGVSTADATTYAATSVALLVATAVASLIPAYRASRVDAVEALRHE